jgi:hypothetical protein
MGRGPAKHTFDGLVHGFPPYLKQRLPRIKVPRDARYLTDFGKYNISFIEKYVTTCYNNSMIGRNQFNSVYRLHLYRKALQRLKQMGFVRVFSDNLADAAGVTPTQVRRDFASFGLMGNKRGGYGVQELLANLDVKLGKERPQNRMGILQNSRQGPI